MSSSTRGQAVIIGAGPGLGRSLAQRFAQEGLTVGLVARDADRLADLATEIRSDGGTALVGSADAADPDSIANAVSGLASECPISVLIYNAAVSGGRLSETKLDELRAASDVNLHSPLLAVQAAAADLERHHGSVLFTGGGFALYPDPDYGVLSVGKSQLRAAALTLALDLQPRGIKVRTVTVAGTIAMGTAFDPDRIADVFWAANVDPAGPTERVFMGE